MSIIMYSDIKKKKKYNTNKMKELELHISNIIVKKVVINIQLNI